MLSQEELQLKLDGNAIALKTDEHSDTSISKPEMDDTGDTHNNRDRTKTARREYSLFFIMSLSVETRTLDSRISESSLFVVSIINRNFGIRKKTFPSCICIH